MAQEYNLLNSLEQNGLDFLIPTHLEKTVSGEYVDPDTLYDYEDNYTYTSSGHNSVFRDEYEPEVWETDDYFYDDEDENEETDLFLDDDNRPETLYDLKNEFDMAHLSDDEFLSMQAGELFGITNPQIKFIDKELLKRAGVGLFRDKFNNSKLQNKIPDIQQRIKYASIIAITKADSIHSPIPETQKKVEDYIEKIIIHQPTERAVNLLQLYRDYLYCYKDGLTLNNERAENNMAVFSYELCPKITHIKDLHDKAMRDHAEMESRRNLQKKEELDKQIQDVVNNKLYSSLLYKNELFSVIAPKNSDDMLSEGTRLNNCLSSYIHDFANFNTLIYFIRDNSAPNEALYAAEVIIDNNTNLGIRYSLMQCYGYDNTQEKTPELQAFVLEWIKKKQIKINCYI